MNCFSRRQAHRSNAPFAPVHCWLALVAAGLAACGAPASEPPAGAPDPDRYTVRYVVTPDPATGTAQVAMVVRQSRYLLRELSFSVDPERITGLAGDGELRLTPGNARWLPPEGGGTLEWQVAVPNRRNDNGYDAWLDENWGLFRAEDIIPRVRSRTLKGAAGDTSIRFELPADWSVVTEYRRDGNEHPVTGKTRRFAQPSGWIVMGALGIRRETIAGVRIAVAAPEGEELRRMDILALLRWTLPELARIVPQLPERITIVGAGEPMWRGGLSAPQSIYVHPDRPLISENATSTLVHELIHVSVDMSAADGHDWIAEGFAEYYALELLRRSGTISESRYQRALDTQRDWSRDAASLCGDRSTGAITALAVVTLATLDAELGRNSDGRHGLDDVLTALLGTGSDIDLAALQRAARELIGQNPDTLRINRLPGCRKLSPESGPAD